MARTYLQYEGLLSFPITLSQVTRHLGKLFDSIADLQFEDDQDVCAHRAIGMFSKEKEYVPFQAVCDCRGHVRFAYDIFCAGGGFLGGNFLELNWTRKKNQPMSDQSPVGFVLRASCSPVSRVAEGSSVMLPRFFSFGCSTCRVSEMLVIDLDGRDCHRRNTWTPGLEAVPPSDSAFHTTYGCRHGSEYRGESGAVPRSKARLKEACGSGFWCEYCQGLLIN